MKWTDSLKFKITLVFSIGFIIAFGINWYIAIKTIHAEKGQEVQNVLRHLLIESADEYIQEPLTLASDLEFLYQIPHNGLILGDSEVSNIRFSITKYPVSTNNDHIGSSIHLPNDLYLNAISDHTKIDQSMIKYGQKLFFRYILSLAAILIVSVWLLNHYMRPLMVLARKTRDWKIDEPFDLTQEDAASEIKEVAQAFSILIKRLEIYRIKETQLFKEAAHELKTPLALMRSRLDVYEQSTAYEKSKFVVDFSRDIERLTMELKNILFLESSDFEESVSIDINEMLKSLKEKMHVLIDHKGLEIVISNATFTIIAPKKIMFKVFGALIENAITYATEKSRVVIDIFQDEKMISISNRIGSEKYLFSSKIGSKMLDRLSKEIGYNYKIEETEEIYTIKVYFEHCAEYAFSNS